MLRIAILAMILGAADAHGAQDGRSPALAEKVSRTQAEVGIIALREAWDFNRSTETLVGLFAGADRVLWQRLAIRGEVLAMRVLQEPADAWLGGFTIGPRVRWTNARVRPFIDIGVGLSHATSPVPPAGTRFNYLAVIGGGVEGSAGPVMFGVTARWLHASNNGRAGRHLNPDIQSLGAGISVRWEH